MRVSFDVNLDGSRSVRGYFILIEYDGDMVVKNEF